MELTVKHVTMQFGKMKALNQISCTFSSGGLIGLVGPNGAGKTTLLKILATLIKPTSGIVTLNGSDIVRNPKIMKSQLGYLPQNVAVYPNLSAAEFLSYMASMKKIPKVDAKRQIPELMGILHLFDTGNKRLSEFSGGMRQRVGIACTLLGHPKVLIVDEPTTGLDPQERITLRNCLSQVAKDRIVILSTHIISDIEAIASKVLILKEGSLVFDGTPSKLVSNAHGHVWEYLQSTAENIKTFVGISGMIQKKDGIQVRQISNCKPTPDAQPVDASLEDACLYALEGISL